MLLILPGGDAWLRAEIQQVTDFIGHFGNGHQVPHRRGQTHAYAEGCRLRAPAVSFRAIRHRPRRCPRAHPGGCTAKLHVQQCVRGDRPSKWHHIAATVKPAAAKISINFYVDGVNMTGIMFTGGCCGKVPASIVNGSPLRIGRSTFPESVAASVGCTRPKQP
jgi:hypothetical protein